ncbi:MAG: hypothetical protein GXY03_08530 [Solirubrobacterales bacterium]|nr:hypothetical protein [Solirubrobacterales bacterium]
MPVISRPLLVVLALAVVALVGFYATQGSRDAASDGDPPAAESAALPPASSDQAAPEPATPDAAAREAAGRGDGKQAAPKADRDDAEQAAPDTDRAAAGMPAPVRRALRRGDTVVLFLGTGTSADDRATAAAVTALRGERGVAVFTDRLARIGRYRALVGSLGIAQAPAVVIVGRDRQAQVLEGYIDPGTLAQDVADAR